MRSWPSQNHRAAGGIVHFKYCFSPLVQHRAISCSNKSPIPVAPRKLGYGRSRAVSGETRTWLSLSLRHWPRSLQLDLPTANLDISGPAVHPFDQVHGSPLRTNQMKYTMNQWNQMHSNALRIANLLCIVRVCCWYCKAEQEGTGSHSLKVMSRPSNSR